MGVGGWAADTGALYARVLTRAARLALRNWPVGLVVLLYLLLLTAVGWLVLPLGIVGGLILYLATVACASSWLHLVEQVIRSGRVRPADVTAGFTAYLGDLLTVGFFFWLLSLIGNLALVEMPLARIVFALAVFVFLNAVPELVYLGRFGAAELLVESYRFIGQNWVEWFPPNIVLSLTILGLAMAGSATIGVLAEPVIGLALYFFMIVRGLLFLELTTSSRRAREFQRRAAG